MTPNPAGCCGARQPRRTARPPAPGRGAPISGLDTAADG